LSKRIKKTMSVRDQIGPGTGTESIDVWNLEVNGASTFSGDTTFSGNVSVGGDLTVVGTEAVTSIVSGQYIISGALGTVEGSVFQNAAPGQSSERFGIPTSVTLPGARYVTMVTPIVATGNIDVYTVPANMRAFLLFASAYNSNALLPWQASLGVLSPAGGVSGSFYALVTVLAGNPGQSNSTAMNYVFGPGETYRMVIGGNNGLGTVSSTLVVFPDDGSGTPDQNPFNVHSVFNIPGAVNTVFYTTPAVSASGASVTNGMGLLLNNLGEIRSGDTSLRRAAFPNTSQQLGAPQVSIIDPGTDSTVVAVNGVDVGAQLGDALSPTRPEPCNINVLNAGDTVAARTTAAPGTVWVWLTVCEI
jgi:hypothetical protein